MGKRKIFCWVFLPTKEDRAKQWEAPTNYIRAQVGEIRLKPDTDTPMNNEIFEPGWKRFSDLDINEDDLVG